MSARANEEVGMLSNPESVFTYGAPLLKFGPGASDEIGFDLAQYGVRRALIITDLGVAATGGPQRVADRMRAYGIEAGAFDAGHIAPTGDSTRRPVEDAPA